MALTNEDILKLVNSRPTTSARPARTTAPPTLRNYPRQEQIGPLKRYDTTFRCARGGCSSPTYFKLQGIPYCMIHILNLMNDMLVAKGVLR